MSALLAATAAVLCLAALREAVDAVDRTSGGAGRVFSALDAAGPGALRAAARLGIPGRLERAGLAERVAPAAVVLAKVAAATSSVPLALALAPAAPGRLAIVTAAGLPAAAFFAPDAMLERRARLRARALVAALPDALDLMAVGAASGRSPAKVMGEIARSGDGPLPEELAVTVAEVECGMPPSAALRRLRRRGPGPELSSLVALIERSARHGSPLADQLSAQASSLREEQRRRVAEQAAKAAPKIQLAVALLLVPSVLLLIAAALIANADLLTAGF